MDGKVKCWQVTPYHNNEADHCIIPICGDDSHHKALTYAKARLDEQWDATAHDETLVPTVEMKIITVNESELENMMEEV